MLPKLLDILAIGQGELSQIGLCQGVSLLSTGIVRLEIVVGDATLR